MNTMDARKIGGWTALLFSLWVVYLLVLQVVIFPSFGLTAAGAHDAAKVLPFLVREPGLFTALWLPELVATCLFILTVLAVRERLRAIAGELTQAITACGLGAVLLLVLHILIQNAFLSLAEFYGQNPAGADAAFHAVDGIVTWVMLGGFLLEGAWITAVMISAWRARLVGGWVVIVGIIAGVLGMAAPVGGVPLGALASLLTGIVLAMLLLREVPARSELGSPAASQQLPSVSS